MWDHTRTIPVGTLQQQPTSQPHDVRGCTAGVPPILSSYHNLNRHFTSNTGTGGADGEKVPTHHAVPYRNCKLHYVLGVRPDATGDEKNNLADNLLITR